MKNTKIKKYKCSLHDNKDLSDFIFFLRDYKGIDHYKCKKCDESINKAIDRENRIREHNKRQEKLARERFYKKLNKKIYKREESIKNDIWDFVVKNELCKGLKLKGNIRELYKNKIPKDVIRLKRASMKLERLINNIKQCNRDNLKKELEKAKKPLVNCSKHGELFHDDVIKSGFSRWTKEQRYKCRKCMSDTHRDYYKRKKNYVLKKHAEYRKKYPDKIKEIKAKSWRKCNGKNNRHDNAAKQSVANNK